MLTMFVCSNVDPGLLREYSVALGLCHRGTLSTARQLSGISHEFGSFGPAYLSDGFRASCSLQETFKASFRPLQVCFLG